jgi:hypothetical protein
MNKAVNQPFPECPIEVEWTGLNLKKIASRAYKNSGHAIVGPSTCHMGYLLKEPRYSNQIIYGSL